MKFNSGKMMENSTSRDLLTVITLYRTTVVKVNCLTCENDFSIVE